MTLLLTLRAASVPCRIATGPRAGQRVMRVGDRVDADRLAAAAEDRCVALGGSRLHANVVKPGIPVIWRVNPFLPVVEAAG